MSYQQSQYQTLSEASLQDNSIMMIWLAWQQMICFFNDDDDRMMT